jgi:quaternary ammonium compound-resistance protein SugE
MNWIILGIAGVFEICFTTCLNKANTTDTPACYGWWAGFVISLGLSMYFLLKATQTIPMGTAYAVWTGIGAVGTALVGILIFREPHDALRLFFIFTLIASIIGLKIVSS